MTIAKGQHELIGTLLKTYDNRIRPVYNIKSSTTVWINPQMYSLVKVVSDHCLINKEIY